MTPIHRTAARVLPVSSAGRVLLLQGQDPARPGDLHWVSIGGAVDGGETLAEAALRELVEETGIVAASGDLVGPIHRRDHEFSWNGTDFVGDSTFFGLALEEDVVVDFSRLEPAEIGNVFTAEWWTPEALRENGSAASPDLPDIMAVAITAVRGDS